MTKEMTSEWRVFSVNEYEWWMARTMEEAKDDAAKCWGYTVSEAERESLFDDAYELPAEDLDRLTITDETQLPDGPLVKRSFREELAKRSAEDPKPQPFASTEW